MHEAEPAVTVAEHRASPVVWSVNATVPAGVPGVASVSATVADTVTVTTSVPLDEAVAELSPV